MKNSIYYARELELYYIGPSNDIIYFFWAIYKNIMYVIAAPYCTKFYITKSAARKDLH